MANPPSRRLLTGSRRALLIDLTLRTYTALGALTAIGGMFFFLFSFLDLTLSTEQQVALAFAGVGAALSAMSAVLLWALRVQRRLRNEQAREASELLMTWNEFESQSKDALDKIGDDFNEYSLRSMIEKLHQSGKISDADLREVELALKERNSIVHRGASPSDSTDALVQELSRIIRKLAT